MSGFTKLVIFDCDGTLVDSQHMIVGSMQETFEEMGLAPVSDADVRSIIGLSPVQAIAALVPDEDPAFHDAVAEKFKSVFYRRRVAMQAGPDPLFDGTLEVLEALNDAGYMLGVATGNSVRGLNRVLDEHKLGHLFVTLQTADHHPSKPHPSMIQTAILEAGAHADSAIMIGDTSYDMMMARAARCGGIGVDWGYHHTDMLKDAGADHVVSRFHDIPELVAGMIGAA
ncbi:HAD-IA family hydrolase [Kordiimonas marina]|uniref:HAD-IA family hydrolase n=1 Tax=Kordiimonas marina TaxID=2872312 RepID=UPI001FF34131|nr:HAD-IA family hydrolase [Kordiimonas marina]